MRSRSSLGVGELRAEPLHEAEPVRESGERVVDRLVRERLAAGLARSPMSSIWFTRYSGWSWTSRTRDALIETQTG